MVRPRSRSLLFHAGGSTPSHGRSVARRRRGRRARLARGRAQPAGARAQLPRRRVDRDLGPPPARLAAGRSRLLERRAIQSSPARHVRVVACQRRGPLLLDTPPRLFFTDESFRAMTTTTLSRARPRRRTRARSSGWLAAAMTALVALGALGGGGGGVAAAAEPPPLATVPVDSIDAPSSSAAAAPFELADSLLWQSAAAVKVRERGPVRTPSRPPSSHVSRAASARSRRSENARGWSTDDSIRRTTICAVAYARACCRMGRICGT